jgi:hypothetical protein
VLLLLLHLELGVLVVNRLLPYSRSFAWLPAFGRGTSMTRFIRGSNLFLLLAVSG